MYSAIRAVLGRGLALGDWTAAGLIYIVAAVRFESFGLRSQSPDGRNACMTSVNGQLYRLATEVAKQRIPVEMRPRSFALHNIRPRKRIAPL